MQNCNYRCTGLVIVTTGSWSEGNFGGRPQPTSGSMSCVYKRSVHETCRAKTQGDGCRSRRVPETLQTHRVTRTAYMMTLMVTREGNDRKDQRFSPVRNCGGVIAAMYETHSNGINATAMQTESRHPVLSPGDCTELDGAAHENSSKGVQGSAPWA